MILSREEAICAVLKFAKDNRISSKTKMNKSLARLNLHFVPLDVEFTLNRWGSKTELPEQSSLLYKVEKYPVQGKTGHAYILTSEGKKFFDSGVMPKLRVILDAPEIQVLQSEIFDLSGLSADKVSEDEHQKLLVDVEDRFKLEQMVNTVHIDLLDLYEDMKKIPKDSLFNIKLAALVEYCYFLTKYLKEKRFARLSEGRYDYDAYMLDYYFLYNIERIIPFLKDALGSGTADLRKVSRYYDYLLSSCKNFGYPFSLENESLKELVV